LHALEDERIPKGIQKPNLPLGFSFLLG
jgi:hypothetical protein